MKKPILILLLVIVGIVATLLIMGSRILLQPTPGITDLPLGNLITWIALISLSFSILTGFKEIRRPNSPFTKWLSILIKVNLTLALFWVPISYLLSGNLGNNFSGSAPGFQGGQMAMKIFWYWSFCLVVIPILIAMLIGIKRWVKSK